MYSIIASSQGENFRVWYLGYLREPFRCCCIGRLRHFFCFQVYYIPVSYTHLDVYKRQVLANLLAGRKTHSLDQAWEKQLFNQFHDILPGSGILETRECAMGEYQKLLAKTNTEISASYRAITCLLYTSRCV